MEIENLNWPSRVANLPRTLDRFRATCVYFDIKFPPFLAGSLDAQKWISWGALSALASIPEVFKREIEELGFVEDWKVAPERIAIRDNHLISVLKELRNFETHLEFQGRRRASDMNSDLLALPPKHKSFFFNEISFTEMSQLNNIKSGRSKVTEQSVNDFNRLSEKHSFEEIIDMTLEYLSKEIESFTRHISID